MGKQKSNKKRIIAFWLIAVLPLFIAYLVMWGAKTGSLGFDTLPSLEELENPKSNLATEIYTADGEVIGKYFKENRTRVGYKELSPYLIDALIATEDERYRDHSGIDFRGLVRAVTNLGRAGGASTITQQLAKMMFTKRSKNKIERVKQKLQEWILAVELEKRYTKEEVIAMYLNKFDFIYNAVGIKSASNVYFHKEPNTLTLEEAAMLIGMAKNPSLYNPKKFPEKALKRREVVFSQMKRSGYIDQTQYDSLRVKPIKLDYHVVDHKEGLAPYFREILRSDITKKLQEKDEDGNYLYTKKDGTPYNLYKDGLRIHTTLDSRMQKYAEWAVNEYIGKTLQNQFFKDLRTNRKSKFPFDHKLTPEQFNGIMQTARKRTARYRILVGKECEVCGRRGEKNIKKEGNYYQCQAEDCLNKRWAINQDSIPSIFETKIPMTVFSYKKENGIDTTFSPNDSIKYYKSFLQTGMMSIDPHTGQIKAWVGGTNYKWFAYDHVKQSKRQVGSTFKPFVYATAIQNGYSPCWKVLNTKYTIQAGKHGNPEDWTPENSDGLYGNCKVSLKYALANSMNTITAWIMREFGPVQVVKLAKKMGITSPLLPVPSLALGVADLSVYEMVGANATFANKGVWIEPTMYTRVEDKYGNVIFSSKQETNEAMSEEEAYIMLSLMKGVTEGVRNTCMGDLRERLGKNRMDKIGTGVRLKGTISKERPYVGHNYPIAGKTGTTQNNSDGWFMGITPDLVTGVWVGAEDRSVRFSSTAYGQGANTALPIWGYYMQKVHADTTIKISKEDFEAPKTPLKIELDCVKDNGLNGNPNDPGF